MGGRPKVRRSQTFGTITRTPAGTYKAYYRRYGKYHTAGHLHATVKLAEAWLRDEKRLIDRDEWTPPAGRRAALEAAEAVDAITFGNYARQWIEARQVRGRPLKDGTKQLYRSYLAQHLAGMDGRPIASITRDEWNEWYATLLPGHERGRANVYSFARAILSSAVDAAILSDHPLRIRGAGQYNGGGPTYELFTAAQVEELAGHMKPQHRLAVLLAAWCGLRFGEVSALQRRDISLPGPRQGVVHVRRAAVTIDRQRRLDTTKTPGSVRDVPVPAFLIPEIRDHVKRFAQPGAHGLLFPGNDGQLITPGQLIGTKSCTRHRASSGAVVKARRATGYYLAAEKVGRPDLSFHKLRHFYGTELSTSGATMRETMAAMGHTTTSAAMRYQHASHARLAELGAILDGVHHATAEPSHDGPSAESTPEALRSQIAELQAQLLALSGDHDTKETAR